MSSFGLPVFLLLLAWSSTAVRAQVLSDLSQAAEPLEVSGIGPAGGGSAGGVSGSGDAGGALGGDVEATVSGPDDRASREAREAEAKGIDYLEGRGVAADAAQARDWLAIAAAAGRPVAQFTLARIYRFGTGVARDDVRALELYRAAADQGIAQAQTVLGLAYLTGVLERDSAAALKWLRASADQEDPGALYLLAGMYRNGDGVERDAELARALLMRSAELAFPPALRESAGSILVKHPAKLDAAKAMFMLEKAAQAKDSMAALWLGLQYLRGLHIERDFAAAAKWISAAADAGLPIATLWRSELYEKGLGVEQDRTRSRALRAEALAATSPSEQNGFSWLLSTFQDGSLRDGQVAIEIMKRLTAGAEHRTSMYLDTLAAAYAEGGRFDDAVAAELDALDALSPLTTADGTRAAMKARLDQYRAGQPYRAPE